MATIKDVAKLAGVSHGTVSNVLSGKAAVSLDKVRKVTHAMEVLGYQPDVQARSLKSNVSHQIGVVLPNIDDPHYSSIFSTIERVVRTQGFVPSLFISSDIAVQEKNIVSQILGQRMAGLILLSCSPGDTDSLRKTAGSIPTVFIERPVDHDDLNFVGSDFAEVFQQAVSSELIAGRTAGLIAGPMDYGNESAAVQLFMQTCESDAEGSCEGIYQESGLDKQSGFRAATHLLNQENNPDVIFTTSELIAEGLRAALDLLYQGKEKMPRIRSFISDSWDRDLERKETILFKPSREIGERAAEILLECIAGPAFFERKRCIFPFFTRKPFKGVSALPAARRNLRVLLMEGDAAWAVQQLIGNFSRESGIGVDIDTLHFSKLHEAVAAEQTNGGYDVIPVDIPWLPELVHNQRLMPLDSFVQHNADVLGHYSPGVIDQYSRYQGHHYGIPFQFGTQLLFYRKDLFDSQQIKHHFYEWYKTELRAPRNWAEFNAVAKFFTREFNAESPVKFGTTLGAGNQSGAVCEYLPRQWSNGGKTFDADGRLTIDEWESVKALDSYVESFQYAQENAADHWWDDQVDSFCRGESAMMMMFGLHASRLSDRSHSRVVGKVGFDTIPGGKPLLGGWSLAVSSASTESESAFRFIQWITSSRMAEPFTILGGLTPSLSLYRSSELLTVYPWLPEALTSFGISTKRELPEQAIRKGMTEADFEIILGDSIADAVKGKQSSGEALSSARYRIESRLTQR